MIPQGYQARGAGHERKDTDVLAVAMIALLLLLLLAVCFLGVWGLFHFLNTERRVKQPRRVVVTDHPAAFPEPRLELVPGRPLAKDHATQEAELNSYGWVNRQKGVAHIPISQAMQLMVERGLPEVGAGQTRLQLRQARPQTEIQPNEYSPASSPAATP